MKRKRSDTLPARELALFCEQVAIALKAGIPLFDAMETLARTNAGGAGEATFQRISALVMESGSLAEALTKVAGFPPYLTGMVRIGENAGKLDDVMDELAQYYEWEAEVRGAVRNAVLYPAALVLMLTVVVAVLLSSVLPVFSRVFAGLGLDMGSSGTMQAGAAIGRVALVVLILALVLLGATLLLLKTSRRDAVMRLLCRVFPAIRRANERLCASRFGNVIRIMLVAGYQMNAAMELAPTVVPDPDYRARVTRAAAAMEGGASFTDALAAEKLFSDMDLKLIRFGSAAGRLDEVMARVVETCRTETDDAIARLVSLIEPTLVTVLSVVIGGILLSVMLPLLSVLSGMA